MDGQIRLDGANNSYIVGTRGDMRKELTDPNATLTMPGKIPRTFLPFAIFISGIWLTGILVERGFGIKRIDMRNAPIHEKKNDCPGFGWKMRFPGGPQARLFGKG